jgi:hypothetical protein
MGIHVNAVPLLLDFAERARPSGTICTLGVQSLPRGEDQQSFFARLGFSNVEALDVSAHEGAHHIFDLNEEQVPSHLVGRFAAVLNGGTLEHVFHIPNALASVTRMLRPGGYVIHFLPCNGYVDHGFYQISPTLMFDYYRAAGYNALESALCSFEVGTPDEWTVRPVAPGDFGTGIAGAVGSGVHLYVFIAQRGTVAIEWPKPIQTLYAAHSRAACTTDALRWFLPYAVVGGNRRELPMRARIELSALRHEIGHCWTAHLPQHADISDDNAHPVRSPLILLEDDKPLGPAHSAHQIIREVGRGTFSHWGDALYFSASDNGRPDRNGHRYTALIVARTPLPVQ